MSDITKCSGSYVNKTYQLASDCECPFRDKCHRFTATSHQYRQSYFCEAPLKFSEDNVPSCEHYWDNKDYE